MATLLEDADTVNARYDQVIAIVDLISFAITSDGKVTIVGVPTLENARSAVDELLKQGRAAFDRIEDARMKAPRKATDDLRSPAGDAGGAMGRPAGDSGPPSF